MSNATTALAKRNAAFEKATQDMIRERNKAWAAYTVKERARNPTLGELYERVCSRTVEDYRAAKALAQKEYLVATPPTPPTPPTPDDDDEWEAGL